MTRALSVLAWVVLLSAGVWALPQVCARPKPSQAPRYFGQTVVQIGRTDKSVYMKTPNHRIDVSMTHDSGVEDARSTPDAESEKAPKLDNQGLPVLP